MISSVGMASSAGQPSTSPAAPPVRPPVRHPQARRATAWLAAYLAADVVLTLVEHPAWLAAALFAAWLASGRLRGTLAMRTLRAVLAFNLSVSAGYAVVSLWQGRFDAEWMLLVNLRVLLLVYLGFWFIAKVNLLHALSFSRSLSFGATIAIGQVTVFARLLREFREAFVSRNPMSARWADHAHHASAQVACLLDKSMGAASESALAMRSRGCFDD